MEAAALSPTDKARIIVLTNEIAEASLKLADLRDFIRRRQKELNALLLRENLA